MTEGFNAKESGFWITFKNGYCVSAQFGKYNYCGDYNLRISGILPFYDNEEKHNTGCENAEVAVINPKGELIHYWGEDEDNVKGHVTPSEFLVLLNEVSKFEAIP